MSGKLIRAEQHGLITTPAVREDIARTLTHYRKVVRTLATVVMTHWPALSQASSRCFALEALCHPTKKRPTVRYPVVSRLLGQMPSYLRRAAIEAAFGVVSSYLSNYSNWLDEKPVQAPFRVKQPGKPLPKLELEEGKRVQGSRPPRMGFSNVYPPLYGGNMIRGEAGLKAVRVKLLGADGQWRFSAPLALRGKLRRLAKTLDLSPTLVLKGARATLVCPVELKKKKSPQPSSMLRVCAVDVGINTAATAVVVDAVGTVIARTFLSTARHDGQRDALRERIRQKHTATGKPGKGFCRTLYRRIDGLSLDAARVTACEIERFALAHGAQAFVFEDLKGWKPKGGSKKQRPRFHRFQHRALFKAVELKAEERGMRMLAVYPRGTSRWAYDGSGKVRRSSKNAQLATFASGKQYNADLNGAQNIAARGLAILQGIENPRAANAPPGEARIPLVLSDIWAYHFIGPRAPLTSATGVSLDAPTTSA